MFPIRLSRGSKYTKLIQSVSENLSISEIDCKIEELNVFLLSDEPGNSGDIHLF